MLAFVFIYTSTGNPTVNEADFGGNWRVFAATSASNKKSYTQVCEENKHKRVDIEMACL